MPNILQKVSPGVFIDETHHILHLDVPALLEAFEFSDTPKNRERLVKSAQAVFKDRFAQTRVDVVEIHQ
jgi:hypothetical protein